MSDAPKKTRRSTGKRKATHADPPTRSLAPQLATLVDTPPKPGDWQWELELDGYRMLARIDGEQVRLFTRNGHDWTSKLPRLQKAIQELKLGSAWLDGEIVIISERGRTDFQALQNAFESTSNSGDSTVIASDFAVNNSTASAAHCMHQRWSGELDIPHEVSCISARMAGFPQIPSCALGRHLLSAAHRPGMPQCTGRDPQ